MMMMTRSSSRWLATLLLLACVLATTSPRVVVAQEDDLLDRISNLIDTIDSEQGSATDLLAGSGENPVDAPDQLGLPDGTSDITDNALLPDTSTTTPPPTTTTPAADDTDRPSNVNDEDDTDDNAGGDFSDLANNIAMMVADQSGDGEDDTNSFEDVTANRPTAVDADDSADDNDGGAGGVSPDLDLDVNDILPDGDADAPEVPPTTTTDDNDSPTVPDATNNTPQDTEGNGQDTALENVDSSGGDTVADVLPEDPSDDVDSAAAIVADIINPDNILDLDSPDFTSDFVDMLTGSNIAADETGLTNPDFNIPSTGESDTDSDSVDVNTGEVGTAEAANPQLATGQPQQQRIRYLTSGGGGGGALGFSGRNRFGAPPPRVREYPVRSLVGLFNPLGYRFISGGGAAAPPPAASGPSYDAQGCLACPEVHQVRARVHPAYNPDPECGACIDAIYLKMRYPELSLDTFNLTEFQDNLAASLGVDYSRIFIESIEEGSVIATVVILPEWIFLAPPNATDTVDAVTLAANETAAPAAEDDGRTALNGTATEEFLTAEASEPNSNATAAATIEGDEIAMSFRSATGEEEEEEEEEEEPYVEVEYSDITLARLHQLLSSHYLQGVGAFDYRVSTDSDPQHCDRFAHSKQEARDIIALSTCDGVGGDCDFVWGEEMEVGDNSTALRPQELLRGFDGGAEGATDMIYESMMMARANDTDLVSTIDNQIPLQKNSYIRLVTLALLDIGRDVELNLGRENEFLLMGGFANLSVTECQDCTCRSDVKWNQPYVEWQKLPALS
jgi:hypothetical protein